MKDFTKYTKAELLNCLDEIHNNLNGVFELGEQCSKKYNFLNDDNSSFMCGWLKTTIKRVLSILE